MKSSVRNEDVWHVRTVKTQHSLFQLCRVKVKVSYNLRGGWGGCQSCRVKVKISHSLVVVWGLVGRGG